MTSFTAGAVSGSVRHWLRAEGLAVLLISIAAYRQMDANWWMFAALLLTPDLAMLAYLAGPRGGAIAYNLAHTYLLPLGLGSLAIITSQHSAIPYLLIWTAHIGMDRMMGYGLKYPQAFGLTHLGAIGKAARQ